MFYQRGHFLTPELKEGTLGDIKDLMMRLDEYIQDMYEDKGWNVTDNLAEQQKILAKKNISNSRKSEELLNVLGTTTKDKDKKPLIEIYKMICGLKGTLSVAFSNIEMDDEDKLFKISFADSNYDESIEKIEKLLGDKYSEMLFLMKEIHDWSVLSGIMSDDNNHTYDYISYAKVATYEKHNEQLAKLKKLVRAYVPEEYNHLFRSMEDNTYCAYVGSVNTKGQKKRRGAKNGDFYKEIKRIVEKIIKTNGEMPECSEILNEIAKDNYLPKLRTTANGVVPNQVYATELRAILNNASHYLDFLNDVDDTGLSNIDKLMAMFKFHIPYYVGPLKGGDNSNAWVVRKENGKVYPWNIEEKVDMTKTSENFIMNLVRRCTYLNDEKVMPANSLLYEKYKVLNELNNLRINERKISVELKQNIFIDLFRAKGKRITTKMLVNYLKEKGIIDPNEDEDCLSGYDKAQKGFTNTLANYHKFMEIFVTGSLTDRQIEIAEDIIYYSTIYGDDKKHLSTILDKHFSDEELNESQKKRIKGLKFKEWSRLSRKFLLMEEADATNGEMMTIINRLWNTNDNLMQVINSDEYTYKKALEEQSTKLEKNLSEITYEDIADSYISAPVRRMVWQTIKVLQEVEEVMGGEPERVFVEMTRSEGEKGDKGRKDSRKRQLEELYKKCKDDDENLLDEISTHDERDFRIKKLYLYYKQKGISMYTGKPIDFEKLFDNSFYDIDHIYPRHYVKDDSLENNLVLVESKLNRDKSDKLLEIDIQAEMASKWKMLHDQHFINDEKYKRLTRRNPFTEEEFAYFIERQIVETGQGTKEVARILNEVLGNTDDNNKVVYVKAGNVSEFRNQNKKSYEFQKSRVVNDHHHAKDAYLNIVVGNTYYTKFTLNPANYIKELNRKQNTSQEGNYNLSKMFAWRVQRNGYIAWDPSVDFETVKKTLCKNSVLVTKRCFDERGQISDLQLVSAEKIKAAKGVGYIPIKSGDKRLADNNGTQKYGGYNKASGAYFILVEHEVKGKRIRTIEPMYVYALSKIKNIEDVKNYCRDTLNLVNMEVRYQHIPMYSHIRVDGFDYYLTGRSNNRIIICNAVQLKISCEYSAYIKKISKAVDEKWSSEYIIEQGKKLQGKYSSDEVITEEKNIILFDMLKEKNCSGIYSKKVNNVGKLLENGREKFIERSIDEQIFILNEILKLSQVINSGADLSKIGGSIKTGITMINKKISDFEEVKLICDSVTGIYQQEIDLLKI